MQAELKLSIANLVGQKEIEFLRRCDTSVAVRDNSYINTMGVDDCTETVIVDSVYSNDFSVLKKL